MICPKCGGKLQTVDTIPTDKSVYRRKRCAECGYRVYTRETAVDQYGECYDELFQARKMKYRKGEKNNE